MSKKTYYYYIRTEQETGKQQWRVSDNHPLKENDLITHSVSWWSKISEEVALEMVEKYGLKENGEPE